MTTMWDFTLILALVATTATATWTPIVSPSQPEPPRNHHSSSAASFSILDDESADVSSLSKRGAPPLSVASGYAVSPLGGSAVAGGYASPPLGAAAVAGVLPPGYAFANPFVASVPAVGSQLFGALPAQLARVPQYVPPYAFAPSSYLAKPGYAAPAYAAVPFPLATASASAGAVGGGPIATIGAAVPAYGSAVPAYGALKHPLPHHTLNNAYFG